VEINQDSYLDKDIAGGVGGGIYDNSSTVTVSNSHLDFNTALAGAGIYNLEGNLTVTGSQLIGNTASFSGGGIETFGGTVQVTTSAFLFNSGAGAGGAIFNAGGDAAGTVSVGFCFFRFNSPNNIDGPWIDLGGNKFV
jgi:hypothetical protein